MVVENDEQHACQQQDHVGEKVDTDILQDTIVTYRTAISDIENAIKEADRAIIALKESGWKTSASREFFNNFDSNWKKAINDRLKILRHLKECLEDAKNDYDGLFSSASQIGNSL